MRRPAGRARKRRWNAPTWVRPFLAALEVSLDVKAACAADGVGVARSTVYEHRERHPQFAAEWDRLLEHREHDLINSAWRRAIDGYLEPVYHKGQRVGYVRRHETGLAIFLLRTKCGFTTPREAASGSRASAAEHARRIREELAAIEELAGREEPPPHLVTAPSAEPPA